MVAHLSRAVDQFSETRGRCPVTDLSGLSLLQGILGCGLGFSRNAYFLVVLYDSSRPVLQ